ncbi:MAG: hypothetical protein O3B04_00650 [Chloroflexi bacterium]|nr:hypothetical protein [Chloroflexota bacterium]
MSHLTRRQGILSRLSGPPKSEAHSRLFTRSTNNQRFPNGFKEQQMVTAAVILSFVISIVLVLVAISQIDA